MKRQFRVKELAEQRGMTQEALYDHVQRLDVKISLATIQRIWQNHKSLGDQRLSTMIAIARALGVSIEDLYENGDKPYLDKDDRSGVQSKDIVTPMQALA